MPVNPTTDALTHLLWLAALLLAAGLVQARSCPLPRDDPAHPDLED